RTAREIDTTVTGRDGGRRSFDSGTAMVHRLGHTAWGRGGGAPGKGEPRGAREFMTATETSGPDATEPDAAGRTGAEGATGSRPDEPAGDAAGDGEAGGG